MIAFSHPVSVFNDSTRVLLPRGEVNRSETIERCNVPRGMFYDSTGRAIVGTAQWATIFTRGTSVTASMWQTAIKLSRFLTADTQRLSECVPKRNFYWLMTKQSQGC